MLGDAAVVIHLRQVGIGARQVFAGFKQREGFPGGVHLQVGAGQRQVGGERVHVDHVSVGKVAARLLVFFQFQVDQPALVERLEGFVVQRHGAVERFERQRVLALPGVGRAQPGQRFGIGIGILNVDLQRLERFFVLAVQLQRAAQQLVGRQAGRVAFDSRAQRVGRLSGQALRQQHFAAQQVHLGRIGQQQGGLVQRGAGFLQPSGLKKVQAGCFQEDLAQQRVERGGLLQVGADRIGVGARGFGQAQAGAPQVSRGETGGFFDGRVVSFQRFLGVARLALRFADEVIQVGRVRFDRDNLIKVADGAGPIAALVGAHGRAVSLGARVRGLGI